MINTEVQEAFERGKREGAITSLQEAVGRAHERIDKHDVRMTALERVMYAGMGVVVVLQAFPQIAMLVGK